MNDFQNEWAILHGNIEMYERFSLIIKLFSVLVSVLCIAYLVNAWFSVALIFVLWLQDGIWKTFQKRMETRIVYIERQLAQSQELKNEVDESSAAFQFYSQWEEQRQGAVGLIKEYLSNAAKPTVAYPYAILISLVLAFFKLV